MKDPIKTLILIENIVCLHRNYSWVGKATQRAIWLRVIFEFIFVISVTIVNQQHERNDLESDKVYFYVHSSFTLYVITLSIYHSKHFKELIFHFNAFNTYFQNNEEHIRKADIRMSIVIYAVLIYTFLNAISNMYFYLTVDYHSAMSEIGSLVFYYLFELNVHLGDFRIVLEFAVICSGMFGISDQLDCIINSVNAEINGIKLRNKMTNSMSNSYCHKKKILYTKWSNAYSTIEKSSTLCNVIFSSQLTAMIVIIVLNYILILYGVTMLTVKGLLPPALSLLYNILLIEFVVALFMLSQAAQRACNRATTLERKIATLLAHSVEYEVQIKATKDLLRLVHTHPIQLKAFGSINVDMTLLPTYIAICTSYTVVALQLRNII